METDDVKRYFEIGEVVDEYARAVVNVGLWESEKILFEKYFRRGGKLLELGCGAGRIAHGLYARGFEDILAFDISSAMIAQARLLSECLKDKVRYEVLDATKMAFPDESFDGAVFGFNGLMQIPKTENRRRVLGDVFNLLKRGKYFIFTTHDRASPRNEKFWKEQERLWDAGKQEKHLDELGDNYYSAEYGKIFIHSPLKAEIEADLESAGFELAQCAFRSEIAAEPAPVREFSDECIFWVARKP